MSFSGWIRTTACCRDLCTYLVKWLAVETMAGRYIRPNPTPVIILETMSGKFA